MGSVRGYNDLLIRGRLNLVELSTKVAFLSTLCIQSLGIGLFAFICTRAAAE